MIKVTLCDSIDELLPRLHDLYRQATVERSPDYTGSVLRDTIALLERMRGLNKQVKVR